MVKRSIEQDLRIRNFEASNGNYERNAVVKHQGTKQRVQRIHGDCWQWETNGQCSRGDNCSFRHDINTRAKLTQPNLLRASLRGRMRDMHRKPDVPEGEVPVVECFDCPARITSKELAPIQSVKNGIRQNSSSRVDANLGKSALVRIARLKNSPAKGPKRMVTEKCSGYVEKYTIIVLRISRCGAAEVNNDFAEELRYTETNPMCSFH